MTDDLSEDEYLLQRAKVLASVFKNKTSSVMVSFKELEISDNDKESGNIPSKI